MVISPAELAERRQRPLRVSGAACGNPDVIALLSEHYPEMVKPARLARAALDDPRVIDLLSRHRPDLVVERAKPIIKTAELRARRMAAGMDLAEFAAEIGISYSAYRNYETGNKTPRLEELAKIAAGLGCDPADLLASSAA